jgi:hypothetical protein
MLASNDESESFAGSGLAVVEGAGGVALSACWAAAAAGTALTAATTSVRIIGRQMQFCAVSPFIALPRICLRSLISVDNPNRESRQRTSL